DTFAKLGRKPLRAEAPVARPENLESKVAANSNSIPPLVPSTQSDTESEGEVSLRSPVSPDDKEPEPKIAGTTVPELLEPKPGQDVVGWHRDSYPWACIVMLSDATTMQGGETAVACADGTMKKLRGPRMGWAIMLQGLYVDHAALRVYGGQERVTMVTSYRAKDVMLPDDSILSPLRPMGHHNVMYYEWSTYRLDLLSERFKRQSEALKKKRGDGQGPWGEELVKKDEFKVWCKEQIKYLQTTIDGMD
ncbi:hypothetical protein RSAG8_10162, partial [Rhizoctonia solani AG-8 WAC10335]